MYLHNNAIVNVTWRQQCREWIHSPCQPCCVLEEFFLSREEVTFQGQVTLFVGICTITQLLTCKTWRRQCQERKYSSSESRNVTSHRAQLHCQYCYSTHQDPYQRKFHHCRYLLLVFAQQRNC